jgi:hypothetical protein
MIHVDFGGPAMKLRLTILLLLLSLFPVSALAAYRLPDTGQTKCYQTVSPYAAIPCVGTGQDGEYTINPLSYTDNGDNTVTDTNTGLMWQKCSVGLNNDASCSGLPYVKNWYKATGTYEVIWNSLPENVCRSLMLAGYSDWRLPSKKELMSIVDYSIPAPGPVISSTFFPNTSTALGYWSSTTSLPYASGLGMILNFSTGSLGESYVDADGYVRCVRGAIQQEPALVNNGNGTVTDARAELTWQQAEPGNKTWGQSLFYCEGLSLGGQSGWRLPNVKELESIANNSRASKYSPGFDTSFFPNAQLERYWSSTTVDSSSNTAWSVGFGNGQGDKSATAPFRCVCGGLPPSVEYRIAGNAGIDNATVILSGSANLTTTSSSDGTYSFIGLANGRYTVTPTKVGYRFTPESQNVMVAGADVTVPEFVSASAAYQLPDTGQTICYQTASPYTSTPCAGTGQDGAYNINPLSYTVNGDGTVKDTNSGLMWQKCSIGQNNDATCSGSAATYNWYQAPSICGSQRLAGYSDWRLPTKNDLLSIVNYNIPYFPFRPAIDSVVFPNTKIDSYWSSTTSNGAHPSEAWSVDFSDGSVSYKRIIYSFDTSYVRCVRGGMNSTVFVNNNDGTVSDTRTDLTWQQGEPGVMLLSEALTYCEGLNLGGKSDWRLPNVKELESLTDDTSTYPAIYYPFFPNANVFSYWSSTTYTIDHHYQWYVNFDDGSVGSNSKGTNGYVRCARGGQPRSLVYLISGSVGIADATVTLSGGTSRTIASGFDGSFSFGGFANGTYTITPTLSGYTFTPASRSVTVAGANVSAFNFTTAVTTYTISGNVGAAGVKVAVSSSTVGRIATSIVDGSYSFTGLANGSYTVTPALNGYTFTPASRSVTVAGANVAAVNFTATALTYTISGNSGIANATIVLTGSANRTATSAADGSYSFNGLTNGFYTVTPSSGGYTFTPASRSMTVAGANITVPAFTATYVGFNISGNSGFAGATVTLSGVANRTTTSAADGSYSFTGLSNGSYTVAPALIGYTFTPASRNITTAGADISVPAFTATYVGYSVSGNAGIVGAIVTLSGTARRTFTSGLDGSYAFGGLDNGSYNVTPTRSGYMFTPSSHNVTVASANITAIDFTTALAYTISGNAGIANATVTLTGAANRPTTSAADGSYSFTSLANGSYTITPTLSGSTFAPASRTVILTGADVVAVSFTATLIMYNLDVAITGSGSVSINPPATGCASGTCRYTYPMSTPVNLTASFDNRTLFTWGGTCSGGATLCSLTMNGNKSVSATFTAAPRGMIGSAPYLSLADAYTAAAATGTTTIMTLDALLTETLTVNKQLVIKGGYNATYTGRTGNPTVLKGTMTIGMGSLVADRVVIR